MSVLDICRECGSHGTTEPDLDPCPGLCPSCIDRHMATVFGALEVVLASDMPDADVRAWMRDQLQSFGIVEPWLSHFVAGRSAAFDDAKREALRREGLGGAS